MKIFVAVMSHETNVFSPIPTALSNFAEVALWLPAASTPQAHQRALERVRASAGAGDFLRLAAERGHEVIVGPIASALPAGMVVRKDYETIRDAICEAAAAAGPLDAVLLSLHGAQVADGYDDCEGDLLQHMRRVLGPRLPIGALLDLHGSLTADMLDAATALVFCKEYPHTDYTPRAEELFDIIERAAAERVRPIMTRIAVPCIGGMHTTRAPGKTLVDHARSLEGRDGILSVSVVHGFSLGDVADATGQILIVSDADVPGADAAAEAAARDLADRYWAIRGSVQSAELSIAAAVDAAAAAGQGPVIIAEPGDNPGGGWPADNVDLLRELIARDLDAAVALVYDPMAVELCTDAGVGAVLPLRIGGKVGAVSGPPIDLEVTVTAVNADARQRTIFGSAPARFGPAVAVRSGRVDIVLASVRTQPFSPDVFTELGVDPTVKQVLQLKSSQHFHAFFAPIASEIVYCNGAGGSRPATRTYRKLRRPVWPLDEVEFDAVSAAVEHYR